MLLLLLLVVVFLGVVLLTLFEMLDMLFKANTALEATDAEAANDEADASVVVENKLETAG